LNVCKIANFLRLEIQDMDFNQRFSKHRQTYKKDGTNTKKIICLTKKYGKIAGR
jgi:hypothetical protein